MFLALPILRKDLLHVKQVGERGTDYDTLTGGILMGQYTMEKCKHFHSEKNPKWPQYFSHSFQKETKVELHELSQRWKSYTDISIIIMLGKMTL